MTKRIPAQPLSISHPEIAAEADGWNPSEVSFGSHQKRTWKCQLGHSWSASPNSRTHLKKPTGCPFCSGKNVWTGFNDLATTHPAVSNMASGWDPSKVSAGSGVLMEWKCLEGHFWRNSPHDQIKSDGRCPYCTGYKAWPGFNDLATTHPDLARELVDADPKYIRYGSQKLLTWQCSLGHKYKASPSMRSRPRGCPYCSGHKLLVGFNDLKTTHPEIAAELLEIDPTSVSKGSNKNLQWRCKEGHQWKTTPNNRTSGYDCPYCSGRYVWPGFNDLATTHPKLARELLETDPKTVTFGSVKKLKWKCYEGHIWIAKPNARTANDSGCPTCAKFGFDPNKEGFLYFLEHPDWIMFQIGITNFPKDRIRVHEKNGWRVLEIRGPMDGLLANQWETAILQMLKAKGADLANSKVSGRFDGYSEAWSKGTFQVASITELMSLTEKYEIEKDRK